MVCRMLRTIHTYCVHLTVFLDKRLAASFVEIANYTQLRPHRQALEYIYFHLVLCF
jgi:hypothetical protein